MRDELAAGQERDVSSSSDAVLQAVAAELARKDDAAARREYAFDLPSWVKAPLMSCLNDQRDEPCMLLAANLALTTLPGGLAVLLLARSHWIGLCFLLANHLMYMQRYMLTLHVTEHRTLFRKGELTRGAAKYSRMHGAWHHCPCAPTRPTP